MSTKYILSIETSCDETSIAVLESSDYEFKILSNIVSSQIKLHASWGGVVPNLAAREHVKNIPSILKEALLNADKKLTDIDIISVVNGPGLIPALLVGLNFAKTLSYRLNIPLIGIHHIEGHIYANFVGGISNDEFRISKQISNLKSQISNEILKHKNHKPRASTASIEFPILCLVVSGGHTQLVLMKDHFEYEIIGQTLDDAVGEAFDKVARILDIGYPGGPRVAEQATKFQETSNPEKLRNRASKKQVISNNQNSISNPILKTNEAISYKLVFPRPMIKSKDFNFSFSGLKTAVLYETKKLKEKLQVADYELLIPEICHEFQNAAVDVLIYKTIKAAKKFHPKIIMLAGGVSANTELRKKLVEAIKTQLPITDYRLPEISLTGDNAAMIAIASHFRWQKMNIFKKNKAKKNWQTLQANANLKLQ